NTSASKWTIPSGAPRRSSEAGVARSQSPAAACCAGPAVAMPISAKSASVTVMRSPALMEFLLTFPAPSDAKDERRVAIPTIVPSHDFASAPQPKLIVVPAQDPPTPAAKAWLRQASVKTDVTMSVCTGAFVLGEAGLLSGLAATTHHGFYEEFATAFPDVAL